MSAIRILPDRVANQIAAGEVIERPVAVVKELVENSLDAGATSIEIEFRNGGKSYIRIADNGKGMDEDEALLSLERHATSKIRETADLNEIASFGFRGEALPSIASVSRFTLRTRTEACAHGTEININGGKLLNRKECGMPIGTMIEVAQLFNAVPARRKFLKTDPTETAHITYTSRLFAVAHPKVAFRVIDSGRVVFQSPACSDLRDRISEIWGRQLADDLIPVDWTHPQKGFRLTGLTAKPGVGRSTRREVVTLVNCRPVDSRTLGFAVLDAYHGRIQKGRYPPAFLFLEIDPSEVDVNVHPAKREVRFRDDGSIRRFVIEAISEALNGSEAAKAASSQTTPAPSKRTTTSKAPESPKPTPEKLPNRPSNPPPASLLKPSLAVVDTPQKAAATERPPVAASQQKPSSQWKLLNLMRQRYALFESSKGLIILHIRHADQRVRFERIKAQFQVGSVPSQQLLIPEPLELEPLAAAALLQSLKLLNQQGFQIEEFGRNFFRIETVPTWLTIEQAEPFLRDFIDMLRQSRFSSGKDPMVWDAIARLAVNGSYQKDDHINELTVQELAEALLRCETPHTSPFGKPTFTETSWRDLDLKLGDVQS
ncbi:MAG: DNA mismatch repair endonuclease MutL [Verrucomicrobiota bacterium]